MLEARLRAPTTEQRDVLRARIILLAAEGRSTRSIARAVGTMPRTVSTWRGRFAGEGLAGLADKPRPGPTPKYGGATGQRILAVLENPPPAGFARCRAQPELSPHRAAAWRRRRGSALAGVSAICLRGTTPDQIGRSKSTGSSLGPPSRIFAEASSMGIETRAVAASSGALGARTACHRSGTMRFVKSSSACDRSASPSTTRPLPNKTTER